MEDQVSVKDAVNHAIALHQGGSLDEAETLYLRVLDAMPGHPDALHLLGVIAMQRGDDARAVERISAALRACPNVQAYRTNLGMALFAAGRYEAALETFRDTLALGESPAVKIGIVNCLSLAVFSEPNPGAERLIIRALNEDWGDPLKLARAAASLLRFHALEDASIEALAADELLGALLQNALVTDMRLERFLTGLRARVLKAHYAGQYASATALVSIACSLAEQCFFNEYVWQPSAQEEALAQRLRDDLDRALAQSEAFPAAWIPLAACYVPLVELEAATRLLEVAFDEQIAAIVNQQVRAELADRRAASQIRRLTDIADPTSLAVARQYEQNPYPRWKTTASVHESLSLPGFLAKVVPEATTAPLPAGVPIDILIAGCGTGRHAVVTAGRMSDACVLAIDLSAASLSYAQRKAREFGLRNVEYAQADILALRRLEKRFHLIESIGVLHHMMDPGAGLRVLTELLHPGGILHLGLYSEAARGDIVKARRLIAERGCDASAQSIRRFRSELASLGDPELVPLFENIDFFSTSDCRDLLFNVQEHRFTVPGLERLLRDHGLQFLGFTDPQIRRAFAKRFPDGRQTDLELWHCFESENPATFIAMYQFCTQKI